MCSFESVTTPYYIKMHLIWGNSCPFRIQPWKILSMQHHWLWWKIVILTKTTLQLVYRSQPFGKQILLSAKLANTNCPRNGWAKTFFLKAQLIFWKWNFLKYFYCELETWGKDEFYFYTSLNPNSTSNYSYCFTSELIVKSMKECLIEIAFENQKDSSPQVPL